MSHPECIHAGRAEALEDLRLSRAEAEVFTAHLEACASCKRERDGLRALHETMRSIPSIEEIAADDVARSRASVLRRVATLQPDRTAARRHAPWMFAAAVVMMVGFVVERAYVRSRTVAEPSPPPEVSAPVVAAAPPVFEIEDVDGAVVQSGIDGGIAHCTLTRGTASFHVQSLRPGQRFLLDLPDGDLEVRGTRFSVHVLNAATRRVDVSEGVVVLRLRGEPERVLRAGEQWSAIAPSTSPSPSATGTSRVAPHRQAPSSPSAAPSSAVETAGTRFVAASRAFQSGSYAQADALLAAFLRDFPNDPRAEDAAFLRAMAHEKLGDHEAAASLARQYLRAHPNGLRRREAERLATPRE